MESYLDLLRVICEEELTENVAPIQLGIRLLIPEGSRMLELEDIHRAIGPFDSQSLVYPWTHADARVDALAERVQEIAASADREKLTRTAAFERIWDAAHQLAGVAAPRLSLSRGGRPVPFLSEPWYCCAEPTSDQLISIGKPKPAVAAPTISREGFV